MSMHFNEGTARSRNKQDLATDMAIAGIRVHEYTIHMDRLTVRPAIAPMPSPTARDEPRHL